MHGLKKIKHYNIVEVLGSGGMGVVYRAIDTVLEREVAIKVMHRHLCDDERTDKRFMQEARVAAGLVHPNIVGIYEIGRAECGSYIVMEYVRGTILSQFLESKTLLDPNLAVKFTLQILSALSFAHSRKTWHRDIKPDNILVTKDAVAKILDFGIAKIKTEKGLTAAGDILGTPEYMAPEQMLDEVSDHRCDIYATGVMLYQILTKRLPFEGENPVAILYKKINEDPVPPSYYNRHIGPELNNIVVKALSKDKGERWDNAKTFSEALEAMESATPAQKPSHTGKQTDLTEFYLNIHPTTVGGAQDNLKATFVGQEKELKRLTHRLRQISNGQGCTVILKGEAGVGKSILANQFEKYAEQNQAWVLSGVCLYQQGLNAYLPFLDALRRFFGRTSSDIPLKEVGELRKLILEEVPLLYELTELSTTDASSMVINSSANNNSSAKKLFESWYHLITLISSIRPLVLIIDDLHMADEASLRLFHYLSHHVSDKSLLILGISRAERYDLQKDGRPTLTAEMLSRINRESNIEQITIYRLCKESCDTLIDRSLAPSLFTEAFYDRIYNETKGNPFFVLETLKLLRSKQVIFLKDGVWHNAEGSLEIDVPQKVEDIFLQRVSALNDEEREILQLASVIGHKFRASQLSPLLQLPTIKLLKILQRIEAGLQIIASTEVGFHFEHPLLRDMLYNDITFALRREYHAMIACDMKEVYQGNYGDKIAEVALHLRNSGQHAEAAPLLYQAAQRSFALGLFHDAIRLINDYLDTADQSGEAKGNSIVHLDLYFKLGKCYEQTGRLDESL
ncbi:protein kinase, partial [candidate division KSB1 bacterium]|nr:protein kinase [candidate division KSB1 bacterium]